MSLFKSSVLFTIEEKIQYKYKNTKSSYYNIIINTKHNKNYNIKTKQYRKWAKIQRRILVQNGRQAQRNINKPKYESFQDKLIKLSYMERKSSDLFSLDHIQYKRSKPIKIYSRPIMV